MVPYGSRQSCFPDHVCKDSSDMNHQKDIAKKPVNFTHSETQRGMLR